MLTDRTGVGGEAQADNILPPPVTASRKGRSRAGTLTQMFRKEQADR
jgi:hypothetical protein